MKLHWGTGLLTGFIVFVIATVIMGVIAMRRGVDLVTEGYYEKGLRYEERLERIRRARALGQPVDVTVQSGEIVVHFLPVAASGTVKGSITLYRPSGSQRDFAVAIALDSTRRQHVPTTHCDPGLWHMQIAWRVADQEYYSEEAVIVR